MTTVKDLEKYFKVVVPLKDELPLALRQGPLQETIIITDAYPCSELWREFVWLKADQVAFMRVNNTAVIYFGKRTDLFKKTINDEGIVVTLA